MTTETLFVERFWARRGERGRLDRAGYLLDPGASEGLSGVSLTRKVQATSELPLHLCLVLLGEPGAGKSVALDELEQRMSKAYPHSQVHRIDLSQYSDESRLIREVDACCSSSNDSDAPAIVLLDGLDECKLGIPHVGKILADCLSTADAAALRLVIACRSADWPRSLEDALSKRFPKRTKGTYELQPLRRSDVATLAAHAQHNATAFLEAVESSGVVALASRPLSLKLLLRVYDPASQTLPGGQHGLYERALLELCDEWNSSRREAGRIGSLSPQERFAVAARVAAAMRFAGASTLATGPLGSAQMEDLAIAECLAPVDPTTTGSSHVTRSAVDETLDTALFTGQGHDRVAWSHQTYMEFLTAIYLRDHASQEHIRTLLCDDRGALIPDLRPVAAWLAALAPNLVAPLITVDPRSFTNLGVDLAHDALKSLVVDGLITHARAGTLPGDRTSYALLRHTRLEEQLRPLLENGQEHDAVRNLAVDIAEDTRCLALQDTWAFIALDRNASERLRVNAGYALLRLGDTAWRHRLLPLALGEAGEDPDDELKGMGLSACWPGALTWDELLAQLTPPKQLDLLGAYKSFLVSDLPRDLDPEHLPELLAWLAEMPPDRDGSDRYHAFGPLRKAAVLLALDHLEQPEVPQHLVAMAIRMGRSYSHLYDSWPVEALETLKPSHRRILMTAAVRQLQDREDVFHLVHGESPLFSVDDFAAALEIAGAKDVTNPVLGYLSAELFRPERLDHVERVLALDRESPLYLNHFAWWCEPMALDCEPAQRHRQMRERQRERTAKTAGWTDETIYEHLAGLLRAADAGDVTTWWQLDEKLRRATNSADAASEFSDDLTEFPGWALLTEADRALAVDLAARYLREATGSTSDWISTDTWYRPAVAGYRAAALLQRHRPEALEDLSDDAWAEWAGIILTFFVGHNGGDTEIHRVLLNRVYDHAHDAVVDAIRARILRDKEKDHLFGAHAIEAIWDDRIAAEILQLLATELMGDHVFGELMSTLLAHESGEALERALDLARSRGIDEERRTLVCTILLGHLTRDVWQTLRPILLDDADFGRSVFLRAAGRDRIALNKLDPKTLGELYIGLMELFPPQEDPDPKGAHFVTPRESVGQSRDGVIRRLIDLGSADSVDVLNNLADRFPQRPWLRAAALEADEARKRNVWTPYHLPCCSACWTIPEVDWYAAPPSCRVS